MGFYAAYFGNYVPTFQSHLQIVQEEYILLGLIDL